MSFEIIRNTENTVFDGCDFVVQLPEERSGQSVRVLQLTDMQIIDSAQRRTPDRIRADEIASWAPENFDGLCGDHIRSLVAQSRPDLIIITGDIVYGSFDDAGSTLRYICELMDSLGVAWAPTFGNHDNESKMGVDWQCEQFEKSRYCLFKRGTVSGNSNYTVGIAIGERLVRVIHMLDSNGCKGSEDPSVIKQPGIFPDQLALVEQNTACIRAAQGGEVPAFVAFHIPVETFKQAEYAKGYRKDEEQYYVIGVDAVAQDDDFGFCLEKYSTIAVGEDFCSFLRSVSVDGVFVGHYHKTCISILYEGMRWTFGRKTGQYDYHAPYQLGATEIVLRGDDFEVRHIPSLVHPAPMPIGARSFYGLFTSGNT